MKLKFPILISLICLGCSDTKTVTQAAPSAPVAKAAPKIETPPAEFTASGPIVVENQLDVSAQREGVITRVLADVGRHVRRGEALALLDDRQTAADRDAAKAKVKSLEADVKGWEYETKVLEADLDRDEQMMKAQLITQQQLEHARYKVEADKFETERSRQNLINAQASLQSLHWNWKKRASPRPSMALSRGVTCAPARKSPW